MGEWKELDLNQIFNLAYGKNLLTSQFTGEGYDVFGANGIIGKYKTFTHEDEEVLVSCRGEYSGVIRFSNPKSYVTNNSIVCTLKETFDKKFLYYSLSAIPRYKMVSGSAQPQVVILDLKKIRIRYPKNISEQSTIALILSTIDRAIEKTERLIAKYERIKTGLMQDLLTRGIDEQGRIRSEETHAFKDSALGRVPVEWDIISLQDCCDSSITYGIVQAGKHIENGVPYIRTGDMSGDSIELKSLLRTSLQLAKRYERSKVEQGDIVFALRATVGKVLTVSKELNGANLTQGTAKISPKEKLNDKLILWMIRSERIVDQIRLVIKGTTFSEISLGNLKKIMLALPKDRIEQDRIATLLENTNSSIAIQKVCHQKLLRQKTALMQDLLTGKVRVDALIK